MIRIIEHGKKRIANCPECGARMIYEKDDVLKSQTGMNEYSYSIKCPECGKEIEVPYI